MPALDLHALIAGRYRLETLIDAGGMGSVYQARDERLDRLVAVKVVHGTDAALAERLTREARLLARLDHPGIVRVYDVGVVDGRTFIVTEYVDGRALNELAAVGPMAPDQVASIGADVARALVATHRAGIVHRDLKPANILITADGARLLDYGIASSVELARLTLDGQVVGTPRYLSPEQAIGGPVGPPADIYSLGLVLLECLTGEPSYPGSMAESLAARLTNAPAVPPAVGPTWSTVLRRMTAREPTDRPTAAAVVASLTAGTPGVTDADRTMVHPAPTPTLAFSAAPPRRARGAATAPRRPGRGRRWMGVVALAVVAALAVAGWALASAPTAGEGTSDPPTTEAPTSPVTVAVAPTPSAVTTTTRAPTTTTRVPPRKRGHSGKGGDGGD